LTVLIVPIVGVPIHRNDVTTTTVIQHDPNVTTRFRILDVVEADSYRASHRIGPQPR
jgi:hypothetical protein